jgi:hypothetical protein
MGTLGGVSQRDSETACFLPSCSLMPAASLYPLGWRDCLEFLLGNLINPDTRHSLANGSAKCPTWNPHTTRHRPCFESLIFFVSDLLFVWSSFVFFQYWGLNSGPSPWATPSAHFCDGVFWDRVSWTICPCWLQTTILLISVSWVARITGVSHWCLAVWGSFIEILYTYHRISPLKVYSSMVLQCIQSCAIIT